jgi:hypothetical protein
MSASVFFHIDKPSSLPIGITFDYIKNIETYDNESIDNIYIQDLLDYYSDDQINDFIQVLKSKLKTGGTITIQSIDIKQLSRAVTFDEIETQLVKQLLYPLKRSIHTLYEIDSIFNGIDMKAINKKYINLFEYYIVIKK